jgi:hypothetical protein
LGLGIRISEFTALYSAVTGKQSREKDTCASWESAALMIPSTREDIAKSARRRKCESCWTRRLGAQNGECAICHVRFADYTGIVPDPINHRSMGGAWRDDHPENIQAVHWGCNGEKGRGEGEAGVVRYQRRQQPSPSSRFKH